VQEILPEVSVLLATFNGEKYLDEFLQSLSNQVGVKINLFVSDDGSSDSTLEILNTFAKRFNRFELFQGPKMGPNQNFFHLLTVSNGTLFAFADQDDLWLPKKLLNSVNTIKHLTEAALVSAPVTTFEGQRRESEPYELPIAIMRNRTQGCTMMFNEKLRNILMQTQADQTVMHDWCALLVATFCGKVIYQEKSDVLYRIHQNNFVGYKSRWRRIQSFGCSLFKANSRLNIHRQASAIELAIRRFCDTEILQKWLKSVDGKLSQRISYIFQNRKQFFSNLGSFGCVIQIIMGSYRERTLQD